MTAVRVLIVDDSRTMRGLIVSALRIDPKIEVVGQAGSAEEARSAVRALRPDVITLDIELPGMDGLSFLKRLMRLRPTPVIVISDFTVGDTPCARQAFDLGAVDCVAKSSLRQPGFSKVLAVKAKAAASARSRVVNALTPNAARVEVETLSIPGYAPDDRIVAMGASTGGIEALQRILSAFPVNCPPTIITQHLPAPFTNSLALRLNRICPPQIAEASDGARLRVGQVRIAPGSIAHLEIVGGVGELYCRLNRSKAVNGHRPSVGVMFDSVARAVGSAAIGVILTGMGHDGANGLLAMRKAGATTIGQDEASSVVYGMPRMAYEIGAVEKQLSVERIGGHILTITNLRGETDHVSD